MCVCGHQGDGGPEECGQGGREGTGGGRADRRQQEVFAAGEAEGRREECTLDISVQVLQRRLQEDLKNNVGGLKAVSSAPAPAKTIYGSEEERRAAVRRRWARVGEGIFSDSQMESSGSEGSLCSWSQRADCQEEKYE